jgi:fumarate hydratase subunit alpha
MKKIHTDKITQAISRLCIQANVSLRADVLGLLKDAYRKETNLRAKRMFAAIIQNAAIAKREGLAICQDTGLPIVFLEVGQDIRFIGTDLNKAIHRGIDLGYRKGYLRSSIIGDPIDRKEKSRFSPGIIHIDFVRGARLKITVLPKGFGCENKSRLRMFNPTASVEEIKRFVIDTAKSAGADACPPFIVGVGIGATADYACLLAKKALLRPVNRMSGCPASRLSGINKLESELLRKINKLGIGPMGLGAKTTALAVNIETYPTHIAGLPVAVNISCHALRSATSVL